MKAHIIRYIAYCVAALSLLTGFSANALEIRSVKFSTPDGLSDNTVRQIYQDREGYIWFATFNGVSRFDGYHIVPFPQRTKDRTLKEPRIRALNEDSHGHLWVRSYNDEISCLDLNKGKFIEIEGQNPDENYRYAKELADGSVWLWGENGARRITYEEGRLVSQRVNQFPANKKSRRINFIELDSQGRTLLGASQGLFCWKDGRLSALDTGRKYQFACVDGANIFAVTDDGSIMRFDAKGKLSKVAQLDGVASLQNLPGAFFHNRRWYISTPGGGYQFDTRTMSLSKAPGGLDVPMARQITDNMGDFWIYNSTGTLRFYDTRRNKVKSFQVIPTAMLRYIDQERYSIARDSRGRAWITTGINGLYVYDPENDELTHFSTSGSNYQLLSTDNLLSVLVDNQDNVWLGSENGGVMMLKTSRPGVSTLPLPLTMENRSAVRMIKKLPTGEIMISTKGGALLKYSSDLSSHTALPRQSLIYDVAVDAKGNVWEGTGSKGMLLNGETPSFATTGPRTWAAFSVLADNRGRIWSGTFGEGLNVLVPQQGAKGYKLYNFLNEHYSQRMVHQVYQDRQGQIWAVTNAGVYRFNPQDLIAGKDKGTLFNADNGYFESNEAHAIIQDSKGRMWVGESSGGITILDFSKDASKPETTHLNSASGLANNNVQAFVDEDGKYIWAATNYGVSRVNVDNLNIESYAFMSQSNANVHSANSAVLLNDGRLLLGTSQGAYTVDLSKLPSGGELSPITVSTLKVNNDYLTLKAGSDNVRQDKKGLVLMLPHDRNNLDFEFTTFDFETPKHTRFRYKLLPGDKEWTDFTTDNRISLKNLEPGKYTLLVEVCGPSGVASQQFQCRIVINSPWWATWWAKIVYAILLGCGVFLVFLVVKRIDELHSKVKIEEQLTDYKLEFFTNISHEFRTPLTLMQVSLEKLHDRITGLKEENPDLKISKLGMPLTTLDKNSRRMSRLIEELLTFRKVEKNKLVLYPEPTEIISFLKDIFDNFKEEANSKHIQVRFKTNCSDYRMNVDRSAMDKIANNLISNALKYTREGGHVTMTVDVDETRRKLRIQVIDDGVGIPVDKREQLFSRFMQSAMSPNSIGVGLHLTFGLVQLHKGTINHSDNPGADRYSASSSPPTWRHPAPAPIRHWDAPHSRPYSRIRISARQLPAMRKGWNRRPANGSL